MTSTTPVVEAPPANHPRQQSSRGDKIVDLVSRYGTIASLVTCIAVFSLLRPEVFATSQNFFNVLNQVSQTNIPLAARYAEGTLVRARDREWVVVDERVKFSV